MPVKYFLRMLSILEESALVQDMVGGRTALLVDLCCLLNVQN